MLLHQISVLLLSIPDVEAGMYTLILESLFGLEIHGDRMTFNPCIPEIWKSFRIDLQYHSLRNHIYIIKAGPGSAVISVSLKGYIQLDRTIHIVDDEGEYPGCGRICGYDIHNSE
ncbi:MAG: hypothetical protein LUQ50_15185 [Methanospirillum sp.]|uniref:glycosyl hydrolase family 65 protein n=1 Tax=Methanospirillum sp. TaxID=45200 RepID=UPI002374B4E3|nr:glycosyl hydrolase family 65 protein [Methanospirillum sp.]MDD1730397.1 hypothetical protein [Methanospirillum sp.]